MDKIVLGYLRGIAGLKLDISGVSAFKQNDTNKEIFFLENSLLLL